MVRALTRAVVLRIRTGRPDTFRARLSAVELPPALARRWRRCETRSRSVSEEVASIDAAVAIQCTPIRRRGA
jgi:hypothetical protein